MLRRLLRCLPNAKLRKLTLSRFPEPASNIKRPEAFYELLSPCERINGVQLLEVTA